MAPSVLKYVTTDITPAIQIHRIRPERKTNKNTKPYWRAEVDGSHSEQRPQGLGGGGDTARCQSAVKTLLRAREPRRRKGHLGVGALMAVSEKEEGTIRAPRRPSDVTPHRASLDRPGITRPVPKAFRSF
ncbi:hypothetical protein AAFF_G00434180 [Aldrovandia affinis]|uniref:Uncharacterized protein n=1 Tax=Aldrovandia affinis TaxID=143900 RepID=A0AAD7S886_9TELE|nr:hypothetical protein AAFF_G00434180 [Aldrovandia affinis]